jgi:hypothetical protein
VSNFEWVAASVLCVIASARITRLIVFDVWPPVLWFRNKWDEWTGYRDSKGELTTDEEGNVLGKWTPLVHCGYCAGMYVAPVVVLSGWLSEWHTAWWIVCGTLSAAYAGAVFVAFDGED